MTEVALRYNTGKPDISQLDLFGTALDKLAAVLDQGAIKYEPRNWLKGGKPVEEYLAAARRHHRAYVEGEVYDAESGCHHLAHCAWNYLAALRLIHDDDPAVDPEFDQAAFLAQWGRDEPPIDVESREVTPDAVQVHEVRCTFEREEGVLKAGYPEPGINTFYADTGRKVPLYPEQVERAENEGILVYL